MMSTHNPDRIGRYIRYALIIVSVVFVVLFGVLIFEYRIVRYEQIITMRALRVSVFTHNHQPLLPSDAVTIRSWMTFDYINKLFALPPGYLKTQLSINDPRYPRMTISGYAASQHSAVAVVLADVVRAVGAYQVPLPKNATSVNQAL